MSVIEMLRSGVQPPITTLKPFHLAVPAEVSQRFLDAVAALDQTRSQQSSPAKPQRPTAPLRGERRAEIEAVLRELMAESRAPADE